MKKFIFALATMVLGIVPTMAQDIANIPDNSIYTLDVTTEAGKQFVLSFQMKNSATVETVGLHFTLPEGITVAKNEKDRLICAMNETRNDGHSLVVSDHDNGLYFASILNSQYPIYGNEGEVFTVTADVAETVAPGTYEVKLDEVELSCAGKIVSENGTYTGKITVIDPTAVTETVATEKGQVEIYNVNGVKLPALQSGLNIVKDVVTGKTSKVTVK